MINNQKIISELKHILDCNKDKRIVVVGTTCTGKTTFLKSISGCFDMDELVFPKLSKEEVDYVCQTPWTSKIGETMSRLAKERVAVESGKPVFGTIALDCDLIVYLKISDKLLKKRAKLRGVNFSDAKNMQKQIEKEIKESHISVIDFLSGSDYQQI